MRPKPLGDGTRRLGLAGDSDLERLEPAEEQPRDVGCRDRARAGAELTEPRRRLRIARDEDADERVVMAGQALRRRMEDDVAPALERLTWSGVAAVESQTTGAG